MRSSVAVACTTTISPRPSEPKPQWRSRRSSRLLARIFVGAALVASDHHNEFLCMAEAVQKHWPWARPRPAAARHDRPRQRALGKAIDALAGIVGLLWTAGVQDAFIEDKALEGASRDAVCARFLEWVAARSDERDGPGAAAAFGIGTAAVQEFIGTSEAKSSLLTGTNGHHDEDVSTAGLTGVESEDEEETGDEEYEPLEGNTAWDVQRAGLMSTPGILWYGTRTCIFNQPTGKRGKLFTTGKGLPPRDPTVILENLLY
ncbi:hypothetical protein PpBr36_03476 [Pyricularia pennisetigena]|uniref:hypothetical protein n=1 Tax=Pyricularia pennisetigena TaxID=1578925 RepID=UPI001152A44D|nr:hypothetical protein PpBr36_03476 [Pyricularia pennisetigena]TLS31449.1 hypothetical protein PpBr36_03476 [Pyricularia pennisetigena]